MRMLCGQRSGLPQKTVHKEVIYTADDTFHFIHDEIHNKVAHVVKMSQGSLAEEQILINDFY